MKYDVIITAAGSGTRMQLGMNKVFTLLAGKPCILYSLETFLQDENVQTIYITLGFDEMEKMHEVLDAHAIAKDRITLVVGGKTRQASVYEALKRVRAYEVLIHDGARPFVTHEQIAAIRQALRFDKAAILGLQATDTVKEINAVGEVNRTLDRSRIYLAQTPQGFDTQELLKVHELAIEETFLGTDDASLIEYANPFYVRVVDGSRWNIKITFPEDIALAEFILEKVVKKEQENV